MEAAGSVGDSSASRQSTWVGVQACLAVASVVADLAFGLRAFAALLLLGTFVCGLRAVVLRRPGPSAQGGWLERFGPALPLCVAISMLASTVRDLAHVANGVGFARLTLWSVVLVVAALRMRNTRQV